MRPEREKLARRIFWMVSDLIHTCDPKLQEQISDHPERVFLYIPTFLIKLFKEGLRYNRYDLGPVVYLTGTGKLGGEQFMGLLIVPNFTNSIVIAHCDAVELGYEWMTASIEFTEPLEIRYQKDGPGVARVFSLVSPGDHQVHVYRPFAGGFW